MPQHLQAKASRQHHWLKKTGITIGGLFLIAAVSGGIWWHHTEPEVKSLIESGYITADQVKKTDFLPKSPTKILDTNGHIIKTLTMTRNIYVPYNKINPYLAKGLVATEDKRFYEHHGVDPYSLTRAVVEDIIHHGSGVQGGSTITQQLIKNVILKDQHQLASRKIKEMVIAQQLEKKYSKHQILEFYLNNVFLNQNSKGIGTAAENYFSTPQNKLNAAQSATLIGIVNNPTAYDPVKHPQASEARRNLVLYRFYEQKIINKQQYQQDTKQPLQLKLGHGYKINNDVSHNYALSYSLNEATEDLMSAHGFTFKYLFKTDHDKNVYQKKFAKQYIQDRQNILNGGYTIRTNINPTVQNHIQSLTRKVMNGYTYQDKKKREPQIASTVVDNKTGNVIAVVGGLSTKNDSYNRAYQAYRQPGSAAKPIVAYAEAFERGYTPSSEVTDSAVSGANIHNWYSGYTNRPMTLQHALNQSVNTVAYKLAQGDTHKSYYKILGKMQFAGLTPQDKNPIIAIGGFTYGVTTTQMASAYASFARQGNFISPSNVQSIYDSYHQNEVYTNPHTQIQVYTPNASYTMTQALRGVVTDGFGKPAKLNNYKYTAGKTGTTDDDKDAYFVGMTRGFTIANWVGDDVSPKTLSYATTQLPLKAFKSVGQYLQKEGHYSNSNFAQPVNDASHTTHKLLPNYLEKLNEQRKKNEISDNIKRLNQMDYRLIYHLTKAQEKSREAKVQLAIQQAKATIAMNDLNDYGNRQKSIQNLYSLNQQVKHMAARSKFDNQINKLERQLVVQKETIEADQKAKQTAKFNKIKANAYAKWQAKREAAIKTEMPIYESLLAKTKAAYQNNDSNKEQLSQQLIKSINKLRSLGENIPNPTVTVKIQSDQSLSNSSASSSSSDQNNATNNND